MKTIIISLLCVSVACVGYALFRDAPSSLPQKQAEPGNNASIRLPAAVGRHAPEPHGLADGKSETALGLRVRKDRNCTVELNDYVTPEGEMFSAHSCTPKHTALPHPYAVYADKTLAVMAYSDAAAAAVLGKRLIGKDNKESFDLLIRASALDGGEIEHIAWLSDQLFGTIAVNGTPQVANIKHQYELAALAARLGGAPDKSTYLRNELIKVGVSTDQIASLDARVETLFESMRGIQQTVLGEVIIGGRDDA